MCSACSFHVCSDCLKCVFRTFIDSMSYCGMLVQSVFIQNIRIFIHSVFRMFIQTVFFQNVCSECDYSAHTSVTLGKCVWAGSLYCCDG